MTCRSELKKPLSTYFCLFLAAIPEEMLALIMTETHVILRLPFDCSSCVYIEWAHKGKAHIPVYLKINVLEKVRDSNKGISAVDA